jgi:hypothetical protein
VKRLLCLLGWHDFKRFAEQREDLPGGSGWSYWNYKCSRCGKTIWWAGGAG